MLSRLLFLLLLLLPSISTKNADIKARIKNKYAPSSNNFWSDAADHLSSPEDSSGSDLDMVFSCFVDKHTSTCEYHQTSPKAAAVTVNKGVIKWNVKGTTNSVVLKCDGSTEIKDIGTNGFSGPYNKVKYLMIYDAGSCNMETIDPDIIAGFPNLEQLIIWKTQFTAIPRFTSTMSKLKYVAILENKITRINDADFANTPALERLNLACNEIEFVGSGAFDGLTSLQYLTLGGNSLKSVPAALSAARGSLVYAGFERNSITALPRLPFKEMANLKHINLTANQVSHIEKEWYEGTPGLTFLELIDNPMTIVNTSSFFNLTQLAYIGLSQCDELTEIEGRAFEALPALTVLEIYNNPKLREVDYRAFKDVQAVYLDMSDNLMSTFPHGLFIEANFAKLERLYLAGNGMEELDEFTENSFNDRTDILKDRFKSTKKYPLSLALGQMTALVELDLSNNKLTIVPDGVLNCFKERGKSNVLDLSNNKITTVEEFAFNEMKLSRLDLSDNRLAEVPRAMLKMTKIVELDLSKNLLTFLQNGYLSMIEVNRIYLDNNQILTVEDGALPSTLQLISMTNNLFDFVDTNQFNNMPSLTSIDLSDNHITSLPRHVFANNSQLASITLDNNEIAWLESGVFDDCASYITTISLQNNGLAFVENGSLANKELSNVLMKDNRLHDWPSDGSLSSQTRDFTADFSGNNFEVIRSYMFSGHEKLVVVNLKNNNISDIESNAFDDLFLVKRYGIYSQMQLGVLVQDNPVVNLAPFSFNNIDKTGSNGTNPLYAAVIDFQKIQTLERLGGYAFNNVTVDYILLNQGSMKMLESFSLNNVTLGTTLQCNLGQLRYIAKNAIVSPWIRYLQFNNNYIRKLPYGAMQGIRSCENFNIQENGIYFIDTDSLPNCKSKFNFYDNRITHIIKDALRSANSIQNLQLGDNVIRKIESGSFSTVLSTLKQLDLKNNSLPEFRDDLTSGMSLSLLYLDQNHNMRTIGEQEDLKWQLATPATNVKITSSKTTYIHPSFYDGQTKNNKPTNVYTNSDSSGCYCGMMQTIEYAKDGSGSVVFKSTSAANKKCTYTNIKNSNSETITIGSNSPNSVKGELFCEPYATRAVRTSLQFVDELPVKESVTVYWTLHEPAVWGSTSHYFCCKDHSSASCISTVSGEMTCVMQTDWNDVDSVIDIGTAAFTTPISKTDECGKEYSKSMEFENPDSVEGFVFCRVNLEIPTSIVSGTHYTADSGWRAAYREDLKATANTACTDASPSFEATYFDLTNDFVDFQNMGYDKIYRDPKLYDSPNLGPYLYETDRMSEDDTLTQWFTPNSNIHGVQQESFCLEPCDGGASQCMFAREWWPVDGIAGELNDTTSNFVRHNMYFTARLRLPVTLRGGESLVIGGPDDIWVYLNGTLILEVLAVEEDQDPLPCGQVTFSEGGDSISVTSGILDMGMVADYSGRCKLSGSSTAKDVEELEVDGGAYLQIFTTQRRSGTSQMFLKLTGWTVETWANFVALSMSEAKVRKGLVDTLDFSTVLGTSDYLVTIVKENDHFEVHDATYATVEDPASPLPNSDPGYGVPEFYNCSDPVIPVTPVTPAATVTVDTDEALVTLLNPIDYDTLGSEKFKYLYLTSTYTSPSAVILKHTSRLRIDVQDTNDNCPVFNDGEDTLIDRTGLSLDLAGTQINVQDSDDGENKRINYFTGGYVVTNLDAATYETYRTVKDYFTYEETMVQYSVDVYAVDTGTPTRFGSVNRYSLAISGSCVQNIAFEVDQDTGIFFVKAPGWMVSESNQSYCDTCTLGYRCPGYGTRIQCTTCRQDYGNEALDGTIFTTEDSRVEPGCVTRSKWEIAFGSQSDCYDCKEGWKCEGGVGTPVEEIERQNGWDPNSHYIDLCTDEIPDCVQEVKECEAGYLCRAGVTEICGNGTYSTTGSGYCTLCNPGTFAAEDGSESCVCCDDGKESTVGKWTCDYCPENEIAQECGLCRSCENAVECECLKEPRPCSTGVQCVNLREGGHTCLSCPEGFEEVEGSCVDIDECLVYDPCFAELNVSCTNKVPGFSCDSCPNGYTGNVPEGIGKPEENQTCTDINECEDGSATCDPNSNCYNEPGYYYCGYCFGRFIGNGSISCQDGDYCALGSDSCDTNAQCIFTGPAAYACECGIGYAGNGTACGVDSDGDGFPDIAQNCNGPTCLADNCPNLPNSDQADLDKDSIGDECDTDIDADLLVNKRDPCPYNDVTIDDTNDNDKDGDGWPNLCDNCINKKNADQYDKDADGVGDTCEDCDNEGCFTDVLVCDSPKGVDSDGDGVDDACDNCPDVANSAQRDTDGDGTGDRCDDDIDGDGVPNSRDNCVYVPNPVQSDTDLKGEECANSESYPTIVENSADLNDADADGDSVPDVQDGCPYDAQLSQFTFKTSQIIDLTKMNKGSIKWMVRSEGRDVEVEWSQYTDPDLYFNPIMLLGEPRFEEVEYEGTFFVRDNGSTPNIGTIGVVFGYQELLDKSGDVSVVKFYLATLRHTYHTYNSGTCSNQPSNCNVGATTGLQIRSVVMKNSAAGQAAKRLIFWLSAGKSSTNVETTLLFQDPHRRVWEMDTAYRWRLTHHPSTGSIRMSVHVVVGGAVETLVDTGILHDKSSRGGRIGVFSQRQWGVIFANVRASCLSPINYAAHFSGDGSVLRLGELQTHLGVSRSFQLSSWFKVSENPADGHIYPIMCRDSSASQPLCLFLNSGGVLVGVYGSVTIATSLTVSLDTWTLAVLQYDMQQKQVRVYATDREGGFMLVGSQSGVDIAPQNEGDILAGSDSSEHFKGLIDEVRVFKRLLTPSLLEEYLLDRVTLERENKMHLLSLHLNFDLSSAEEDDGSVQLSLQDVSGNVQMDEMNSDSSLLPGATSSDIISELYRYGSSKSTLENGLKTVLSSTGERRANRRPRRSDLLKPPPSRDCNSTGCHDEL